MSTNDALPNDRDGITSMVIEDLAWTNSGLCVVVGLSSNYFCVVSRLGGLIRLRPAEAAPPQNFFVYAPPATEASGRVRVDGQGFWAVGASSAVRLRLGNAPTEMDLASLPKPAAGMANCVLRLMGAQPRFSLSPVMLQKLSEALDEEIVHYLPRRSAVDVTRYVQADAIQFQNPFPRAGRGRVRKLWPRYPPL